MAMKVVKTVNHPLRTEVDIVQARHLVRKVAAELKFSLVDQTKIVTAASELSRNTIVYGLGGELQLRVLENPPRMGLELVFTDKGPGIPDLQPGLPGGVTHAGRRG